MEECFTINRLDVPPSLHRCLATASLIENPLSGVRMGTRRICRWRDKPMRKRWAGAAFLAIEKSFRRIMGHRDLWALQPSWTEPANPPLLLGRGLRKMVSSAAQSLPTMFGTPSEPRLPAWVRGNAGAYTETTA